MWLKNKVSCEEKLLVDSDSWGSIKQPYVGGFSTSIRWDEFSTPKVCDSCRLIFLVVIIPMKIFETYRVDWSNWDELLEFFLRIFCKHSSPETRIFAAKTWFCYFWSYKTRDSGAPMARHSLLNNSINRSKLKEHLTFFSELFLHTTFQKRSLKCEKHDFSVRKCHRKQFRTS